MRKAIQVYVLGVSATALLCAVAVFLAEPSVRSGNALSIVLLCGLAVMAELLAFLISKSVGGSVAFIPYMATVLIVPNWVALLAVIIVKAIAELRARERIKAIFNIAQHTIGTAAAILLYRALGGVSLLELQKTSLLHASLETGLPAVAAVFLSFALNGLLVSGVIALSSQRRIVSVWRENFLPSMAFHVLAAPVIFLFAWIFVAFGPMAAAALWVPILGLRQVHKANVDLERTNRELLELLVKSIEARDPYTSGHSRRVQHYSMVIARIIGLHETQIEQVGHAALLHDVGKIYEKYAPILAKADKLTPDEWATMQEHPVDGANLVATMTNLKDVVPAVRHHHEKWDGTGYPDGLVGDLIPLASRIIAFADTIDAMTSERPYRRPLAADHVRAEIVRCRGKQFDPAVADRLLSSPMWSSLFSSTASGSAPHQGLRVLPRGEARRVGTT